MFFFLSSMAKQINFPLFFLFFCFSITSSEVQASYDRSKKLFVFGDSYVDTGNCRKPDTGSWKQPYGITFPGKPTGRFSDGLVLTDYIASYLDIRSPIPYKWRKYVKRSYLEYGMNFAYGGTGVFQTLAQEPNMTVQIDFFQRLVEEKVYGRNDLSSSIALVSLAGNDYSTYLVKSNKDLQNLPGFTISMTKQLAVNLERIHRLGVRKVAVLAIEPMGCLPQLAAYSSYQNCSKLWNSASKFHNQRLRKAIQKLNSGSNKSAFFVLDLYKAFTSAMKKQRKKAESSKLMNPLQPCCVDISSKYFCGNVDKNGAKMYTVCKNPEQSFFWDTIHPSQHGWHAVYLALRSSLHKLF